MFFLNQTKPDHKRFFVKKPISKGGVHNLIVIISILKGVNCKNNFLRNETDILKGVNLLQMNIDRPCHIKEVETKSLNQIIVVKPIKYAEILRKILATQLIRPIETFKSMQQQLELQESQRITVQFLKLKL